LASTAFGVAVPVGALNFGLTSGGGGGGSVRGRGSNGFCKSAVINFEIDSITSSAVEFLPVKNRSESTSQSVVSDDTTEQSNKKHTIK
jgi:hypothetical protein